MNAVKQSNLVQAWLVIFLAVFFGVSLAGIESGLRPVIDANKTRETMERIPVLIDPGPKTGESALPAPGPLNISARRIKVTKGQRHKFYTVYDVTLAKGGIAGHVAKASGQGYADKIEVLIGFAREGKTITGLFVLDQKETPGLGNKILETSWRSQFAGRKTDRPLEVVQDTPSTPYEIDGISGATISSRSVTDIVNTTMADIRMHLARSGPSDPTRTQEKTP